MISKQSWGNSSVLFSLLFLLIPIFLTAMDISPKPSKPWYDCPDEELAKQIKDGTSLLQMKWAYESAPQMVKDCVLHLKDPQFYDSPGYRWLVLYGPPGSGKSTLAKAIFQYAGLDQVCYRPSEIQDKDRNSGAKKLSQLFEDALKRNIPMGIIFEEFNQWLENAESKHHDTDSTSKEFWIHLDKLYGQYKLFIICTANRIHKIPQQIKSRIKAYSCEITSPQAVDKQLKILKRYMNSSNTQLSNDTDDYLVKLLKVYSPDKSSEKSNLPESNNNVPSKIKWDIRDYAMFHETCKIVYRETELNKKNKMMKLDEKILQEALRRTRKFEADAQYSSTEETDEERQERHHTENLNQQNLHVAQNIKTQLLIQRNQKNPLFGLRTPGLRSDDANAIDDMILTQEQERILVNAQEKARRIRKPRIDPIMSLLLGISIRNDESK